MQKQCKQVSADHQAGLSNKQKQQNRGLIHLHSCNVLVSGEHEERGFICLFP